MIEWGECKPLLKALALPPVPWLVLVLVGARLILPRRGLGYLVLLTGVGLLWLSSTAGTALLLQDWALRPPPPVWGAAQSRLERVGREYVQQATRQATRQAAPQVGIMVLGGGVVPHAPEYGMADLGRASAERLRYGVWLSRRTGLPLGFSGGVGWGQKTVTPGPTEAEVASRVAVQMYGVPLRWIEKDSPDTRGNATASVALLAGQGVTEIVVVTEAWHMPRARRAFEQAAAQWAVRAGKPAPLITPAAMGYWSRDGVGALDWLPSMGGVLNVRLACHELLGLLMGG
ncbi:MAG: YdcF family protein [Burkholderiales bacterium]|nr:YdcF family protein [Burkholderiales bacterium]